IYPIKTLIGCTSVCKHWNSFIKSPSFISTHLNSSTPIKDIFFICLDASTKKCCYHLEPDDQKFDNFELVNFPFRKTSYNVLASINGLLFISTPNAFILWNPTIHRCFLLSDFNSNHTTVRSDDFFIGFGYDSVSDDYKFVKLESSEELGIQIEVFSLKSDSWNKIASKSNLRVKSLPPENSQAFVNGDIHCIACKESGFPILLKFDLGDEVLSEITLPKDLGDNDEVIWSDISPIVYKDSTIGLFDSNSRSEQSSLWLMKKYGVENSWARVLTLRHDLRRNMAPEVLGCRNEGEDDSRGKMAPKILGCRKDGEIMVVEYSNEYREDLYAYKLEENSVISWRIVITREYEGGSLFGVFVGSIAQSLVLLNH
ncbi:F-box protein CPR1-like, partial [Euphorbia lathyris]|uniref:F-box protein CPR1-like n=1 Tax=Euphorbia lathyris TaxID=212925 RepID=UPI00331330C5